MTISAAVPVPSRIERVLSRVRLIPIPVVVAVTCFLVYGYRPLIQGHPDIQPLRWGAAILASQGTLDFRGVIREPDRQGAFWRATDGSVRGRGSLGTAVLAAPVFLVARGLGVEFTGENVALLDSVAASLLTAVSAGMVAWLVRRRGRRTALFLGIASGLATASWAVASRCLWPNTGAQFCILAALCFLDSERRPSWRLVAGGAALAWAAWCRPFVLPACLVILGFELLRNRRDAIRVVATAVVLGGGALAFNRVVTGHALGVPWSRALLEPAYWGSFAGNLVAVLFSPNRGIFAFSPLLLMAIPGLALALFTIRRAPREAMLALAALVTILPRSLAAGWFDSTAYGSRHMLDSSPFLLLLMAPLAGRLLTTGRWRILLPAGLLLLSGAIQWLGVTREYGSWNTQVAGGDLRSAAWNWKQGQVRHCLTYGESTLPAVREWKYYIIPPDGIMDHRKRPADSRYLRYGVVQTEQGGRWLVPPRAGMVVNCFAQMPLKFRVELATDPFPFDPTVVGLYWNGVKFGEMVLSRPDADPKNQPWLKVPSSLVRAGLNAVEFRVNRASYPGASPVPMGASLGRITILPDV